MKKIFSNPINFNTYKSKQLFDISKEMIYKNHGVLIKNFPLDHLEYVRFLEKFGLVYDNYGYGSDSEAYSLNPKLNRVKYYPNGTSRIQEISENLPLHSARAWGHPRPKYFSMLMVNHGWINSEVGENGESIYVKWLKVLIELKKVFPLQFIRDLNILRSTKFPFKPSVSKDQYSELPILYEIENQIHEYDLGCRISLEMLKKINELKNTLSNYFAFKDAIDRFTQVANSDSCVYVQQLYSSDAIILDNNRIGHGRKRFKPSIIKNNLIEINPREIWSAVIE